MVCPGVPGGSDGPDDYGTTAIKAGVTLTEYVAATNGSSSRRKGEGDLDAMTDYHHRLR